MMAKITINVRYRFGLEEMEDPDGLACDYCGDAIWLKGAVLIGTCEADNYDGFKFDFTAAHFCGSCGDVIKDQLALDT